MVVVGGSEIMTGCGLSWVVVMKLWLVVGGGSKVMAGSGCWQQNMAGCGCLLVVVGADSKMMVGRGWLWMVVDGC